MWENKKIQTPVVQETNTFSKTRQIITTLVDFPLINSPAPPLWEWSFSLHHYKHCKQSLCVNSNAVTNLYSGINLSLFDEQFVNTMPSWNPEYCNEHLNIIQFHQPNIIKLYWHMFVLSLFFWQRRHVSCWILGLHWQSCMKILAATFLITQGQVKTVNMPSVGQK